MIAFLGRYIIAIDGSSRYGVNVVAICVTIMTKIMTDTSNQHRECIKFSKVNHKNKARLSKEVMAHLHYISTMKIIVILNLLLIR